MNPIKRFKDFISGPVDVNNMVFRLNVKYDDNNHPDVTLIFRDNKYQKISVDVPESKKLESDEFFMKSDVKEDIVKTLIDENFIEKTGKKSKSGLDTVFSYKLI